MTLSHVLEIVLLVMFLGSLVLAATAKDPAEEMRNLGWAAIILLMEIARGLDALPAL